ncbi:MAG TPA: hypothetical protein PLZ51_06565, partial [Aggregatilineales bacterium]|nr:hypothetical protein [Aggregatilineales bacterium]
AEPGLNQLLNGLRPIFDAIGKIVAGVVGAILSIPDAIKKAQDAINIFNGNAEIIKQTQQAAINSGMGSKDVEDLAYAEVSDAFGGGILGNLAAGILAPGITNQALSGRNQQIGNA